MRLIGLETEQIDLRISLLPLCIFKLISWNRMEISMDEPQSGIDKKVKEGYGELTHG